MADQHPITPPPELIQQWVDSWYDAKVKHDELTTFITTQAARWGADQELEACCEWAASKRRGLDADLRAARRPKPQSLKEQALATLESADGSEYPVISTTLTADQHALIRRALEQLDD